MSPAKAYDPDGSLVPTSETARAALEEAADEIIFAVTGPITAHSEKSDILTPWKEWYRRSREIYVPDGSPDRSLRMGWFHRAYNPQQTWLNSRDPVHSTALRWIQQNPLEYTGAIVHHRPYAPTRYPEWRLDDGKDWPVTIRRK